MRAQIVVALVVALTLVAVPLYLMRRPGGVKASIDAGVPGAPSALSSASAGPAPAPVKPPERIRLAAVQRVRCGAGLKGGQEGNLCDSLGPLEEALAKTIRENENCAPKLKQPSSINYVLTVDFTKKLLHVFPGASGDLKGRPARRSTVCIERALPKPDWDAIRHQYRYYSLAILTSYLPESAVSAPGAPRFE